MKALAWFIVVFVLVGGIGLAGSLGVVYALLHFLAKWW